jgi:hypothetical protein
MLVCVYLFGCGLFPCRCYLRVFEGSLPGARWCIKLEFLRCFGVLLGFLALLCFSLRGFVGVFSPALFLLLQPACWFCCLSGDVCDMVFEHGLWTCTALNISGS